MKKTFALSVLDQQPSENEYSMNAENTNEMTDELREEYDFSQMTGGVRGKYAKQCNANAKLIMLEPDVAKIFHNAQAVNEALRTLAKIIVTTYPTPNHSP